MADNIQHKLQRIRPPRVNITYDVETENSVIKKSLPCIIGIIADLTGKRSDNFSSYEDRQFVFLNIFNFNEILYNSAPMASVAVTGENNDKEEFLLTFKSMEDFNPINIIKNIPQLFTILEKKRKLTDLCVKISNSSKLFQKALVIKEKQSLDGQFDDYSFATKEQEKYFMEIFSLLYEFKDVKSEELLRAINSKIKSCNDLFKINLDSIFHNESFKKLESTWRGLQYLVKNGSLGETIKIRVLNATFDEIEHDLNTSMDFDQSYLFQKLYEEEFGTYGGSPYTALLVDHYLDRSPKHINFVRELAKIASCAHLTTIMGTHPSLLDLESFEEIPNVKDFSLIFESNEMVGFRNFRNMEESRYIGLVLPRFISRLPYGPNGADSGEVKYTESIDSHEDFCWTNTVYLYGQRICTSFAKYNWLSSIVGPENGGMIDSLPVYLYKSKHGDDIIKCPTEIAITDRKEYQLSKNGFITLCYCKDQDYAVFFSGQSANKPILYDKDGASANANISSRIQYMLNASRFAHYIKCIMRDKIGTYSTPQDIESYLTEWLSSYILLNAAPTPEQQARIPLKGASVRIVEDEARPGCYSAIILIQPHFQMEELTVSLRLVARMPAGV